MEYVSFRFPLGFLKPTVKTEVYLLIMSKNRLGIGCWELKRRKRERISFITFVILVLSFLESVWFGEKTILPASTIFLSRFNQY